MQTAILYNPVAGRGRARATVDQVVDEARRLFGEVRLLATERPGDGVRLAREAAEQGAARLLVVGGDGTVHEAANGVMQVAAQRRPALAVVPEGTGNDFAKLTGTHGRGPRTAVRGIAAGRPARFDLGEAWGEYFVNTLGVGLDAEVARQLRSVKRLRGTLAYAVALLKALRTIRPVALTIEAGAERFEGEWLLAAVGVGPVEGGGFHLLPGARPDDGLLDLCAVRPLAFGKLLALIPTVMAGKHGRFREVSLRRADRITFRGTEPLAIHSDGELRAPGDRELVLTLHPGALPVILAG
ncbi:MAG TPA: diacylglycerol kinase family protein [Gemmatimonadales bacterium]|nr:diacylglycerol kinase family protein [Gemmatimonadales bacterium]